MNKNDWQRGEDSTLTTQQRIDLHIQWLKQLHKQLIQEIQDKNKDDDDGVIEIIIGFPD